MSSLKIYRLVLFIKTLLVTMDDAVIIAIVTIGLCFILRSLINLFSSSSSSKLSLPPGPRPIPIISGLQWMRKSFSQIEPIIRSLHAKYGPVIAIRVGSRVSVFVSDRQLAHKALVQNGAVFSNRPPASPTLKVISASQHNISSAFYGPTWRLFRRNLNAEILHSSRVKSYGPARKWVLDVLISKLMAASEKADGGGVKVVDHFQYAMFCLLVFMCFGDRVADEQVREVERVQRDLLLKVGQYNILNFWPRLGKYVFRKKWAELYQIRKNQEEVLIPLIRARNEAKKRKEFGTDNCVFSYVDSLLELELPEEKRKLTEKEMVSLCSEFLNAGTDTTSTALQWIMANLVKHQRIQDTLVEEIRSRIGTLEGEIKEEDLHKLPYLKATVLEGLRRHPPAHFVLPHAVSKDTTLDGHLIPKKGTINFMVADMGWDPEVWEDPMEFKPERFLVSGNEGLEVDFDVTGSKEIKMMPFGAGRRICPGYQLAMLHLEYFTANLISKFRWIPVDDVSLEEKQEFTMVMKHPLQARLELGKSDLPWSILSSNLVASSLTSVKMVGLARKAVESKEPRKWRTIIMSKLSGRSSKQQHNYSTRSSSGSCSGDLITIPEEFLCPISNSLMTQPVIVSSGHTFDLYSIQNLHFVTPSLPDGSVPDFSTLIPNLALRSAILNFCSANSIPFPTAADLRPFKNCRDDNGDEFRIVAKLRSGRVEEIKQTLESLRELTRSTEASRIQLCTPRILSALKCLLVSRSGGVQANAVATLVNLSLEKVNKVKILRSGIVPIVIDVVRSGFPEAKEYACSALFSLAIDDANKTAIGVLGALQPLVHALRTPAKNDAAWALYHLSMVQSNRTKLVKLGVVTNLLSLVKDMHIGYPVLLVFCNMAACVEGRTAMLDAGVVSLIVRMLGADGNGIKCNMSESCMTVLYELSRGGLRFRILAKEAGCLEVLRKLEFSGNEGVKVKARKVMEAVVDKWEEIEEDVDWEELIDLGFANGNGSANSVLSATPELV